HSSPHCTKLSYLVDRLSFFFFFNDTATTEIYTLSLHDALPISILMPDVLERPVETGGPPGQKFPRGSVRAVVGNDDLEVAVGLRSEEHTSELQSLAYLVCRLLLEKKKKKYKQDQNRI